jgi:hypothetical protein
MLGKNLNNLYRKVSQSIKFENINKLFKPTY